MLAASDIQSMSFAERIEAMELIWKSLSSSPGEVQSPAWHGNVLQRRLEEAQAGQATFLTMEQLKDRLRR